MSFEYSQEVADDYEKLFEVDEEYDVIINAGENENAEEIHAHSLVLRTRSQYFCVGFSKKWTEKINGKYIFKKPNISPKIFKIILRFFYCGKIELTNLQGSDALNLLMAADELNIQTLIPCIQHNLINYHDEFLQQNSIKILDIVYQHESFMVLWNFYLEKICESPRILFNSDKFINLNPSLFELFLQRDDLDLEEIKVWENLIKWGLAQEKCLNKDVSKWHREEFNIFKSILHNFIPLIRFYEISPEDYFKKVKPYEEILPKELRGDILKCHTISGYKSTISKLLPRCPRYFVDSKIINQKHAAKFASWINRQEEYSKYFEAIPYEFNLIFRGSRDGFGPLPFHKKCDNKGANIVVIKIKNSNQIIGGYNPLDWGGNDYIKDTPDSFIFSFSDYRNIKTGKIGRVIDTKNAIIRNKLWGPLFGYNKSSYVCDIMLQPSGVWYSKTCSYPNINIPITFEIDDYEVFQVKIKSINKTLKKRINFKVKLANRFKDIKKEY